MRVYLDVCCLNRPFDDQTQDRIRLEAEAILLILRHFELREWSWVSSETVELEISQIPDDERRMRIRLLIADAVESQAVGTNELDRSRELQILGFHAIDALHLACAESINADVFLTTDDRLLRVATRNTDNLKLPVTNPLVWLAEVTRQ